MPANTDEMTTCIKIRIKDYLNIPLAKFVCIICRHVLVDGKIPKTTYPGIAYINSNAVFINSTISTTRQDMVPSIGHSEFPINILCLVLRYRFQKSKPIFLYSTETFVETKQKQ